MDDSPRDRYGRVPSNSKKWKILAIDEMREGIQRLFEGYQRDKGNNKDGECKTGKEEFVLEVGTNKEEMFGEECKEGKEREMGGKEEKNKKGNGNNEEKGSSLAEKGERD